ncbi:ArsR/SmtB family transcription factor [Microbacterium sp. ASV49]|uniref:Metalloregulator ArsR/SmtB family transcription factor n=1 Tax=Microbacterium candidum TaxID=3041922 RepID=A0ABT7N1X4_9MICO|nr:metalloregulator ArsR/SmtB family transcription factor [Microbacterium sp. ASV49]MDL9980712.1 metalloregulator ArsR/SmtB family transcription factor [Microbacterium sp. ASV49]
MAQTFAAIGDPVRLTIVDRLTHSDATVGELVSMFEISFQAVSQHIDVLERAGLVTRRREGRTRRVSLQAARLDEAAGWMDARRRRLEERYARLDDVLAGLTAPEQGDRA